MTSEAERQAEALQRLMDLLSTLNELLRPWLICVLWLELEVKELIGKDLDIVRRPEVKPDQAGLGGLPLGGLPM